MAVKVLQILICAVSLMSIQGCFVWHSTTTVRDNPPAQTKTVVHESVGNSVTVTTTR